MRLDEVARIATGWRFPVRAPLRVTVLSAKTVAEARMTWARLLARHANN